MKHTLGNGKRLGGGFLTFLIAALLFLAVSLGTAGSLYGAGEAFELRAKLASDTETPSVTFRLNSSVTEQDENGKDVSFGLRLKSVYVDLAAIYGAPDAYATLRLERSTNGSTFTSALNAVFENVYMPEEVLGEDGKPVKEIPAPDATDAFFRFVAPFAVPDEGWTTSTYPFMRLSLYGENPNVLINEVVFVGEKLESTSSSSKGTGEMCVIPCTIYAATPYADESVAAAVERAGALIDAQAMPANMQSTFGRFTEAELPTLKTIAEMRLGNTYAADADGASLDTYDTERVYGALGTDILALGTLMFGMSPFGLRFFPVLAAFGALVALSRLAVRITRKEKAGAVFAVLYALSALTVGFAHLGTPLMLAVFFFAASLDLVHAFYANGMKRAKLFSALPLLLAGLCGAAAVCIQGAFVIPMAGVVGLFAAGMVRQQKAKRYRIEKALAEPIPEPEPLEAEGEAEKRETPAERAERTRSEFRFRNRVAPAFFGMGLLLGILILSLLAMLPAYFTFVKAFDDPALPAQNVFAFAWRSFAGGFAGVNTYSVPAWSVFAQLFRGTGSLYAVTALTVSPIALLAGGLGLIFALYRLLLSLFQRDRSKSWRAGLRRDVTVLALFALAVIAAVCVKDGTLFVLLMYLSAMLASACFFGDAHEGRAAAAVKIANIVGAVLLAVCFALLAAVVFSIPLPASFWTGLMS